MPLFRLLPGRPRSTFSSTTFFLGGIFFGFEAPRACVRADVVKRTRRMGEKLGAAETSIAVLAAGRVKVGITEEKEKTRCLGRDVVKERREGQLKDSPSIAAENGKRFRNERLGCRLVNSAGFRGRGFEQGAN
jgi:hypothetical protein